MVRIGAAGLRIHLRRGKEGERPSPSPMPPDLERGSHGTFPPSPLASRLGLETWAPLASFSTSVINYGPFQLWTVWWTLRGSRAQDIMYTEWLDDWPDSSCTQFYTIYSFVHHVTGAVCTQQARATSKQHLCHLMPMLLELYWLHHHLGPLFKMMISATPFRYSDENQSGMRPRSLPRWSKDNT